MGRAPRRARARARAASALTPRGEFSIIIASLAVGADVQDDIGPLAAAYVLITAVCGPILMRVSDPLARRLIRRRHAAQPAGCAALRTPAR